MSDVIVSTTESTTNVTTTNDVTTIAITDTVVEVSQATAGLQGPPGSNSDPTYVFVTNKTGTQLNKGAIVYVSGANGTHTQVTLALASGDVTSARTLGWLSENIADNATGLCMVEGYLDGVNTQGVTEGAQLYLSPTVAGGFTETKPTAPFHMVYVGVCAKASAGNGRVFVKVQNGYELDELHNVKITNAATNDLLRYVSGTALWVNTPATAITVGSAITAGTASYSTNANTSVYASTSGTAVSISGTITRSQVSDYASGTVANITGSITRSQVSNFASGTVAVAGVASYADESGTALYATNAGYATTSGTAVSISGSITRLQVSNFASGTVANISGTVTQSQVTNLTIDLAGKANLVGGNSFTGAQVISASTATQIPVQVRAAASPSVNVQEWDNSAGDVQASIDSNFRGNFPRVTAGSTADLGYAILSVNTGATANIGAVIRGVAGQSAGLTQWQNSGGTVLAGLSATGRIFYGTGVLTNSGGQAAGLSVTSDAATVSPIVVRGAASQTANLQEWQTSSGGTSARVDSGGIVYGTQVRGLSSLVLLTEASGGGLVTLARATATPSSPGANTARLYFRDGTNANTLKLVVRAGAAGAETTILDNIPT
ncbi:MAG: hypothetical protein EBU12_05855 [Microbacteriaceae bacterium]|nr:hypothetical protein [Microbacteriaceae bacterium]